MSKRYKTKHNQTKKHEYYSNLILNRYVIKNVEVSNFKEEFISYFSAHSRKYKFFTISILLRLYNEEHPLNEKINVTNYVTYNIESENYSFHTTVPEHEFLQGVIKIYLSHRCSPKIIPEIEIAFKSDLKDITRQLYLELPKSILCRKLIRRYHESTPLDFEYKWLPDSFKHL